VPQALPFAINWSVAQGGLADQSGLGTGFTMADPPSARLAADGAPFSAQVPGYAPERLRVDGATGTLVISSTKGIQFRDPTVSSNTNSQLNALGVGLPAGDPLRISTTLVRPAFATSAGNSSQQAGLWFGLNENNYVKLVVVKTSDTTARLELSVERYGAAASGPAPITLATANSTIASPDQQEIDLILEIDPAVQAARGFYQINGAAPVQVAQGAGVSLSLPEAFFAGADHDGSPASPPLIYAGVLASQRNAAQAAAIGFAFRSFSATAMAGAPLANLNGFSQIRWVAAAPQPQANSEGQSTTLNGKIYSFGGFDSLKGCCTPTDRAYSFDPMQNKWTALAALPYLASNGVTGGGMTHAGIANDGTYIYLASGYIAASPGSGQSFGTKQVWRYDPASDSYTRLPDLPQDRAAGMLAVVGRELHYFGGTNKARTLDVGDHWALNLDGGTSWAVRAALPNPRHHLGAVVYGGRIYVVGGQHGHDGALVPQDTVNAYDPATNTWATLAPLPLPRNHISSSTVLMGDRIIVMGGQQKHNAAQSTVYAYTIATNSWQELTSLPEPRHSAVGGMVGGRLYFSTGATSKSWMGIPVAPGGPDSLAFSARKGLASVLLRTATLPIELDQPTNAANLFYCSAS
jgi:N-acetylneuraminic acid mutarotase